MAGLSERVVRFGPGRGLVATLTEPIESVSGRPAFIIPNTGLDGRVGPNRIHVHLCRTLAESGFPVLRLDLSGIGESEAVHGDSREDLRAAMDWLEAEGVARRFVMIGLCSGAHDAHRIAQADERVVGLFALDGYAWPTVGFRWRWLWNRLRDRRRLVGRLQRLLGAAAAPRPVVTSPYYQTPRLDEYRALIDTLLQRGVRLAFLYTGGVHNEYNYRTQLVDAVPALANPAAAEIAFWPHADHTFTRAALRHELAEYLRAWAHRRFSKPTPAS